MLIGDLLEGTVRDHPDRIGVDFLGRTWTWAQIGEYVARAARGLQDLGLRKGDRLALCLPNTPYYIALYYAAARIGVVIVNLNPLYTERELTHLLTDSGACAIAVPDVAEIHGKVLEIAGKTALRHILVCPMAGILPWLKGLGWRFLKRRDHARIPARETGGVRHVRFDDLIANRAAPDPVAVAPHDLAVLQYTGGTTGIPKGAMLTHRNLTANALQQQRHIGVDLPPPQRTLAVLPFFHVFALTAVLDFSVLIGSELVLLPRFEMKAMLATIRRKPPTMFFGVPTLFIAINALPDKDIPDLSTVIASISGGAPLPHDVRHTFEARTGARICEGYGLTEASPVIACNPVFGEARDDSCGVAFPGTILEIRDPDHPERILGVGERGEVCARGPQVMAGYWKRPDETAATFIDGALRTGDVGYFDADGYLYLVDRIKDVILCGGYNVYPRLIEEAAYEHPAIEEAIAIGIPDPYRGQSPKLFIKLHDGTSLAPEDLRAFLSERLSKIELPKAIEIRDRLPRTMIGKLSKKELVEEERARAAQ
ncbi:long-chain fatty acid--CoA ligase [Novosphingobium nitrogenifigens DSM 19370]|uniref:Long-chain fatty acid--CoA ligase n=1 Tax=Novosphingobium nitrogenifigens DSM 19370 TaxID=983920 RepID=F1ZAH5_9SPHN|nr:long-chain fatty acid--CoA ligase [Novosphingobium nitrogenifigens]EGD58418.1 long-chain fatty acid--CoA ligase [Novosphingobium nitrogenifigens DSM 19370]